MPATTFQATVGTTPVQASTIPGLNGVAVRHQVRVLALTSPAVIAWGTSPAVTAQTGYVLPNGSEAVISPADIDSDLRNLYFVAGLPNQMVSGVVV